MREIIIENLIKQALLEDMPYGDITTDNLIPENQVIKGYLLAKEDGIIAGLDIFMKVFHYLDQTITFKQNFFDGKKINKGDIICTIEGSTRNILKGERLALNILQRMSGIATLTNQFVEIVKDYPVRIVDTRKTTPNFRFFEKEAVRLGGGYNHRYNLSDAVMIKDNHIAASGGITKAVNKLRQVIPHTTKIEVEVENLVMLQEALLAKVDIVMLDNMSLELMKEAVRLVNRQAIVEASGNMTLERVLDVAKCGVDIISVGALTHSFKSLDISLRFNV